MEKIIWTISPTADVPTIQATIAKLLNLFAVKLNAIIEPVSIVASAFYAGDIDPEEHLAIIENRFKSESVHHLLKPKVITTAVASVRAAVDATNEYAEKQNADLIAVGTHGRSGLSRFFLGSFAESLILTSKKPLIIVGPKAKNEGKIERILFPTDFTETSRKAFEFILAFAKNFDSKVILFHSIQPTGAIVPVDGSYVPYIPPIENEQTVDESAREWIRQAESKGVPAEYKLETKVLNVGNAIISFAEEISPDLIAMAAISGKIEAAIIGSVTRQTIRNAVCPVFVVRDLKNLVMQSS
jgi:nucleotide-binding universal stress UspA family protein